MLCNKNGFACLGKQMETQRDTPLHRNSTDGVQWGERLVKSPNENSNDNGLECVFTNKSHDEQKQETTSYYKTFRILMIKLWFLMQFILYFPLKLVFCKLFNRNSTQTTLMSYKTLFYTWCIYREKEKYACFANHVHGPPNGIIQVSLKSEFQAHRENNYICEQQTRSCVNYASYGYISMGHDNIISAEDFINDLQEFSYDSSVTISDLVHQEPMQINQSVHLKKDIENDIPRVFLNSGTMVMYEEDAHLLQSLEEEICRFLSKRWSCLFSTGWSMNVGGLQQLYDVVDQETRKNLPGSMAVFSDEKNHASIVMGLKSLKCKKIVFKHLDVSDLENKIEKHYREFVRHFERKNQEDLNPNRNQSADANKIPFKPCYWIVAEGLYSMSGSVTRLDELVNLKVKLKDRIQLRLYIDEAHSIGCFGRTGRGICEMFSIDHRFIDVLCGTFTKAFSSIGGYIATDDYSIIDRIKRNSLIYLASNPIDPLNAYGLLISLRRFNIEKLYHEEMKIQSDSLSKCDLIQEEFIQSHHETNNRLNPLQMCSYNSKIVSEQNFSLYKKQPNQLSRHNAFEQIIEATLMKSADQKPFHQRIQDLNANIIYFWESASKKNIRVISDPRSHIIAVPLGNYSKFGKIFKQALLSGIALVIVGPPATPLDCPQIRICLHDCHTLEMIDALIEFLKKHL